MQSKIVITSYKDLDMDGYASTVAYQEILRKKGINAIAAAIGNLNEEINFVLDYLEIEPIEKINSFDEFNSIILVDTDCVESTEIEKEFDDQKVIEIIDHHIVNRSHLYPSAKIQIDPIGACATILVERYQHEKIIPSKQTATMLYAGIVSNTINLRNKVTTKRDIQAASFLKKIAEIPDDFVKKMFTAKSDLNGVNLRNLIEIDYYERSFFDKIFSMSQIEAVGINSLVKDRVEEIREIIKSLTSKNGPDYQFINLIDILDGYNIIIAFSKETENLLTKVLNIKFEDGLAKTDYIIMRKEIIAKLKDYFDSKK